MDADFISFESMLAARESANWAYWTMLFTFISVLLTMLSSSLTLWAVLVAKKGLDSWKEQQIAIAKANWISSLVNYASEISYLPEKISYKWPHDKNHIEKAARLMYECIRCWKVLDVHLKQNKKMNDDFHEKYDNDWRHFSVILHNNYLSESALKKDVKEFAIKLYNK